MSGMEGKYVETVKNPRLPGFRWREPEEESDLRAYRNIVRTGCHLTGIHDEDGNEAYVFSTGLYLTLEHPDFIMIGKPFDSCSRIINSLVDAIESGKSYSAGQEIEYSNLDFRLKVASFPEEHYPDYLGFSNWFYFSIHEFPVFHLMWSDRNGYFPDDPECEPRVAEVQKVRKLFPDEYWEQFG